MQSDTNDSHLEGETNAGLVHLLWVVGVFLVCAGLTYLAPQGEVVRPWVRGEPVPLWHLLARGEQAGALGPSVAGAVTQPVAPPRAPKASSQAAVAAAHARQSEERTADGQPLLRIAPSEFEGVTRAIDHPENLVAFYAALAATANKKPNAITRVAHYGDSAVAADGITSTMRRLLQARFGDAGHGFVLTARGNMHYIHRDIRMRSGGEWNLMHIVRGPLRRGWYGYGGVQYRGSGGANATFETPDDTPVGTAASRFEVFFQKGRGGGELRVSVDGDPVGTIETRSETTEDGWQTFEVPDGEHSFSLRVGGRGAVTMYGVALERSVPGVVYDSLGLVGARANRLLNADAEHMRRQIAHRSPELLVLAFGGNESGDPYLVEDTYRQELRSILKMMRGNDRSMSCLLFAPLDQGQKNARGVVETVGILPGIVAIQAEVARSEGCAFYNAFDAMGGEGSMWTWYKHRPRWATSDFRHATPEGYEVMGEMFYKALLQGFAQYLAQNPQ